MIYQLENPFEYVAQVKVGDKYEPEKQMFTEIDLPDELLVGESLKIKASPNGDIFTFGLEFLEKTCGIKKSILQQIEAHDVKNAMELVGQLYAEADLTAELEALVPEKLTAYNMSKVRFNVHESPYHWARDVIVFCGGHKESVVNDLKVGELSALFASILEVFQNGSKKI